MAAITVVGTLMMGVLRRYRLATSPATSRQTPPPMAMMGSFLLHSSVRLSEASQQCEIALAPKVRLKH